MIQERNEEIVRNLYSEMSTRKQAAKSPSRSHSFTQYTFSAKPSNLKTFKNFFTSVSSAFPDYDLSIESMIEKGDRVMVRYTISGTQEGVFMGVAPTHERTTITGIDVFRLDKGKIIEHWDAAHQVCALANLKMQPNRESENVLT